MKKLMIPKIFLTTGIHEFLL